MALAPRFAGHRLLLTTPTSPTAPLHTIELYLDYVCPFSAKLFDTFYSAVVPRARKAPYAPNVQFLFRQQIQPWHPSSTLVHEAALAVLRLAPAHFWPFSAALFARQTDYFDVSVVNEPRNATYRRLAQLAASVGVDEAKVYEELRVPEQPDGDSYNVGNRVTDDLKLLVKAARLTGVHVSPTVLFNGVVENGISSSFSPEQWDEWLAKNVGEGRASL